MQPQPGELIRAPFLSAPAEVKKFEPRSGYYLLEVVLDDGHHTFKPLRITAEQLAQQEGMPPQRVGRQWRLNHETLINWIAGASPLSQIRFEVSKCSQVPDSHGPN
jgi:hypothetical protein